MRKSSSALLSPNSPQRIDVAAAKESPSPVQSATYAARHTGHFGMSTQTPSDMAPAAVSQALRDREMVEGCVALEACLPAKGGDDG
ncbi:MAG TPA: hypothetical protein VFG04_13880 [Planctomycetaceae bacterium]|jgi:hypothetical protein|nr:hypothetical protein [Planctomycetaceae bacterium]